MNRTIFVPVLVTLFVIGSILRLLSGYTLLNSNLTYAAGKKEKLPGTRRPEDAARTFYMLIDRGEYERAWEISLEPDWSDGRPVGYREELFSGQKWNGLVTSREVFVDRLTTEIGKDGWGITLNNIKAERVERLDGSEHTSQFGNEVPEETYRVLVRGQMVGACSIFRWEKQLIVISSPEGYRVFLNGTKEENSFFYQSWFSGIEPISHLR